MFCFTIIIQLFLQRKGPSKSSYQIFIALHSLEHFPPKKAAKALWVPLCCTHHAGAPLVGWGYAYCSIPEQSFIWAAGGGHVLSESWWYSSGRCHQCPQYGHGWVGGQPLSSPPAAGQISLRAFKLKIFLVNPGKVFFLLCYLLWLLFNATSTEWFNSCLWGLSGDFEHEGSAAGLSSLWRVGAANPIFPARFSQASVYSDSSLECCHQTCN